MGMAFDVQEYWDLSDAQAALESALYAAVDPVREFESKFASFVGGLDALFLISGREALYQALQIIGVGPGDEVIMSAFNCTRVADAVLRRRATPVLVDIKLPGGEVDLDLLIQALSPKVRAVLIPHLYGVPVDFRQIREELKRRGVVIIEDCAHCVGGTIGEEPTGTLGAFSIFSFNTGKPITLGNGGMLVCSDPRRLEFFRRQKATQRHRYSHDVRKEFEGIKRTLDLMTRHRRDRRARPPYLIFLGRKLRQHPLMHNALRFYNNRVRPDWPQSYPFNEEFNKVGAVRACLGISLLQQWPEIIARRNENAQYLRDRIREDNWGETQETSSEIKPAYYKLNVFAPELAPLQVDRVISRLRCAGFRAGRWPFLNSVPHLVGRLQRGSQLSNMRKMAEHSVNLPIHQNMEREDLNRMLEILRSVRR